jgi:hypothetical protein
MNGICALILQDVFYAARNVTRRGRSLAKVSPCMLICVLAACEPPGAPTNAGVCWRAVGHDIAKPRFAVVANDVSSLDNCAALLETYHLRGATTSNGAYQGYFIFIDRRQVSSSTQTTGFRYPIFQPSQRREIDEGLQRLIKERAGRPISTSDVAVERQ